jgi:hypothetical protein
MAKRKARRPTPKPKRQAKPKPNRRARRPTDVVAELKAIGRDTTIDVAVRVRALSKAGDLEAKARSGGAAKLGKKEIAAAEAETAGEGTDWGNDLNVPPTKLKR